MGVYISHVSSCIPGWVLLPQANLKWKHHIVMWLGTWNILCTSLNYGMIQRVTASCFVALQSSSCLSRIQPVNPQCITQCSKEEVLLPTLLEEPPPPLAAWVPNLQSKLHTAEPVVNLLASHTQKLTRVHWRLSCARNQHIQHTVLMPTGWNAKEMPDIILTFQTLMIEFWKAGRHGTKLDSTGWVALVCAITPLSLHNLKLHACSHHFCTWVHKRHGTLL